LRGLGIVNNKALLSIALFEMLKGMAALAASVGLLSLAHHDVQALAYALLGHFHVDPQAHFPRMLLDDIRALQNADMRQVVLIAWGYAALRLTEGYGLWRGRVWAEWLAAVSGAVHVPLELSHLVVHPTAMNVVILGVHITVVVNMVVRLRRRRSARAPR
jgi:uncharacterized membrane protein (DUF2068 family)